MRLSIGTKLFIAIFLTSLLTIAAALGLVRYQVQTTYLDFVREQEQQYLDQLQQNLVEYYQAVGRWDELRNRRNWFIFQQRIGRQLEDDAPPPPPDAHGRRRPLGDIRRRTVLLDPQHQIIQSNAASNEVPDVEQTLLLNGQVIGYIGLYKRQGFSEGSRAARFLEQQTRGLWWVALGTLIGSMIMSYLLARQWVKPIRNLQNSTRELANGNYKTHIQRVGSDELGQLSHDFNQLAQRLQQHEQSRRQWIMDIAHELRTPLSVLRGEIEAIQDGIVEADEDTIHSLHQETLHLQRLVDDLYNLSMSDNGALSYHKEKIDITQVLLETLAQFAGQLEEQALELDTHRLSKTPLWAMADGQRLQQLLQNVLKNSLRYTDTPGRVRVLSHAIQGMAEIVFEDSEPGVPDEALPLLFNRLYRVDASRNRATGGAGIGLSICSNIVAAHEGNIRAEHSELGGLKIIIRLPLLPTKSQGIRSL
ncbi:ATP-binding protein [Thiolinea disciformis]|uniref:ATP-binding protein n=1 Tax=Thiolinea disciformis TaxID=125614 RepID=UPI0003657DAC|nr:ATP-binding protein [Thiolinea disciformis]